MKRLICTWMIILIGGERTGAQEHPPQVRAILDKALQAQGGQPALQKLAIATWQGRGILYRKEEQEKGTPFFGEWCAELPVKFRALYKFRGINGFLPVTTVLNGDKGWRSFTDGRGSQDFDEKRFKEEREEAHAVFISRLAPLLDGGYQLTAQPIGKRDGRYIVGLKVEKPGYRTNRLYFDRQLGLLTYMDRMVFDTELSKDVLQETSFQHFQPMGGATLPQSITIKRDGKLFMEMEITKVEAKPSLDDQLFTRPPDPKNP